MRLALAFVAWCLVCPLLCARAPAAGSCPASWGCCWRCCPLALGPWALWACFLLWRWPLPAPWCRALLPCLWGPLFTTGSVVFSLRPSAACLSPWCWCCPPGALGLCGGCASTCSTALASVVPLLLCSLLGALGLSWQEGVLLGCCLAAWCVCLACLAFPLGAGPCLCLFSSLGVEAWVSGG